MEITKKKALARQGILLRRWLLARTPTAAKKKVAALPSGTYLVQMQKTDGSIVSGLFIKL